MKLLPRGKKLFRGGACKTNMSFFALDPKVAKMYGSVCAYTTKRPLRLFTITHDSLKRVFKYLSPNAKLLMSFIFGTGIRRTNQELTYKRIMGNVHSVHSKKTPGQRLSVTEIDTIALATFSREYILKHGYDGVYMPTKKSKFHKGIFHSEIFIAKRGCLLPMTTTRPQSSKQSSSSQSKSFKEGGGAPISELFVKYTRNTKTLLKPHPSQFVMFLGGGMAVKLYLRARGIKTAKTSDFDFKFAVPHVLKTKKQIEKYSNMMRNIMYRHVSGFVRFLNRNGIPASMEFKEVEGVPIDKPGGLETHKKKVYKVYNYTIVTSGGRRHELVDTSLVVIPGITRKHISLKWSRKFGMPIQTLTRLWKDTLYVLAGSFVVDTIKLRNPINGAKKEKGIKNAMRAGHLSYLTAKKRGTTRLVDLSRKLIGNVVARNKTSGIIHSKKIMKLLQSQHKSHRVRSRK